MATVWPPIVATKPPQDFNYRGLPPKMLAAMLETGVGEAQALALIQSLIKQTMTAVEAGERIAWPKFGTWYKTIQSRTIWINPRTGGTTTTTPCWQYAFRQNWRWHR